jgi:hypothetical protein
MQAKKFKNNLNDASFAAKIRNSEAGVPEQVKKVVRKAKILTSIKEASVPPSNGEEPPVPQFRPAGPSDDDNSDNDAETASQIADNQSVVSVRNKTIIEDVGSFPEFSSLITNTYWGPMTKNSTTLDIIAVYLRGQKTLYIDSKIYCEQKLNYLMMPTIFITAVCSIISMVLKDYPFGATIVSCLTGLSTCILALISYLKMDAKAEAHKTSAYQFDKLQTMCEFFSGKVLLIKDDNVAKKVQDFVTQIEKKIEEIKDVNQFIIPEVVRHRYPKTYSVNVFSEIKRYKNREKILRYEFHTICQKIDKLKELEQEIPEELTSIKEIKLNEVLEHQNEYFKLDDQFEEEVNAYVNSRINAKGCCSRSKEVKSSHSNLQLPSKVPVIVIPPELTESTPKSPVNGNPKNEAPRPSTSADIQSKLAPKPSKM